MCLKTIYRAGFARRVVQVDPAVSKRAKAVTNHEDNLHQNDPQAITLDIQKPTIEHKPPRSVASQAIDAINQQQFKQDPQPNISEGPAETTDAMQEAQKFVENARANHPPEDAEITEARKVFGAAKTAEEIEEAFESEMVKGKVEKAILYGFAEEATERIGGEAE